MAGLGAAEDDAELGAGAGAGVAAGGKGKYLPTGPMSAIAGAAALRARSAKKVSMSSCSLAARSAATSSSVPGMEMGWMPAEARAAHVYT